MAQVAKERNIRTADAMQKHHPKGVLVFYSRCNSPLYVWGSVGGLNFIGHYIRSSDGRFAIRSTWDGAIKLLKAFHKLSWKQIGYVCDRAGLACYRRPLHNEKKKLCNVSHRADEGI